MIHCHDLHHASNAGQEPGGLIVPIVVKPEAAASRAPETEAPASPSLTPSESSSHTMAPEMTEMPGMGDMPGMTH